MRTQRFLPFIDCASQTCPTKDAAGRDIVKDTVGAKRVHRDAPKDTFGAKRAESR